MCGVLPRCAYRLGVAWWRYPDESHNGDGRHTDYLGHAIRWRSFDPVLFDRPANIVSANDRRVGALQTENLLEDAVFCEELIPTSLAPPRLRVERAAWFQRMITTVANCNLLFLDPDNGLEPRGYSLGAVSGGKCVSVEQLKALASPARSLIVYHHQTRRKGVASHAALARTLNQRGVPTPKAAVGWTHTTVARLLLRIDGGRSG